MTQTASTPLPLDSLLQEALLDGEVRSIRGRNEKRVAVLAVIVATLGALTTVNFIFALEPTLGAIIVGICVLVVGYYGGFILRRPTERLDSPLLRFLHVSFEVSIPFGISLADLYLLGPVYTLTSTPQLITFLAVAGAGLRLDRRLAAYAGGLACLQYLVLYSLCHPLLDFADPATPVPLRPVFAVTHAAFLAGAGVLAASIASAGHAMARRVVQQLVEQERVRGLFGEFVAPEAADRVIAGELELGGQVRTVSLLFADIRGFTAFSAGQKPEVVVAWLNAYFGAVCEVIGRHGGMVNKFMGDGLLAVFGAPEEDPEHARNAARAALELVEAAEAVERPDGEPTRTGTAVHTGEVVLGSIGSKHRKDYTVIGDTVNVASRIEGLTGLLDRPVLLSAATLAAAGDDLVTEALEPVAVKGLAEPIVVHALKSIPAAPTLDEKGD